MQFFKCHFLFAFLLLFGVFAEGYKILGIFPTAWSSHWKVGSSVLKQLAAAEHDITFVSRYELKTPKVRNVLLTDYPEGENVSGSFQGLCFLYV